MTRVPNTIETATGRPFDYFNPVVEISDVAHGLSHVCRFAGHTTKFFSVAEHSLIVHALVSEMEPRLAGAALFHDGHEAYLGDIPTPLKDIVGEAYTELVQGIDAAVGLAAGIDPADFRHPIVKAADDLAVVFEAAHFKEGPGWRFARAMRHEQATRVVDWRLGLGFEDVRERFLVAWEGCSGG